MKQYPPVVNVQPGSWGQPLHARGRERYVYSEKELRRAINDAVSSPVVNWDEGNASVVTGTGTYMTIVIAAGITVTSTIIVPATASGLKITQTGGGFLQPSAEMVNGTCFSVRPTPDGGKTRLGLLVWFDGLTVKWAAGDDDSAFETAIEIQANVLNTRITDCFLYGKIDSSGSGLYITNTIMPDGSACSFGANTFISNSSIGHSMTISGKTLITGCDLESITVAASTTDVVVTGCRIDNWTDTASSGGNLVTGCLINGTVTAHASSSVDDPGGTRVTNNNF